MISDAIVRAEGLTKSYGGVEALVGLDLEIEAGSVLALLSHNGAGKSTAIGILSTLIRPDAGRATICGRDVVREAGAVRELISLAGQRASLDELLSGRENLVLLGRLQKLPRREARIRAARMLERFDLVESADRVLGTYSGGMRRRLDLAACLLVARPLLFLDEPTTGLDPLSRAAMWELIREVVADGTAVLLTTQYLEEADRLADRITVLHGGAAIAAGTPGELKRAVGERRIEIVLTHRAEVSVARAAVERCGHAVALGGGETELTLDAKRGAADLEAVLGALAAAAVQVEEAGLERASLDDVFAVLTDGAGR